MDKEDERTITDEFSNLEEIFEMFFGFSKRDTRKNKKAITTYNITKQQAKQGVTKNVKISVADICDTCKGKNNVWQCKKCYGRGFIYNEKIIELRIPPKIKNNDYIVIEKQGNQFNIDEERGDLFIRVHIYGNKSKRKGKIIYE